MPSIQSVTISPKFRSLIPPLADDELAQLEANILADGCRDPLVTWEGILLDGHNRYAICQKHGIKFETIAVDLADETAAKVWVIRNQFGRRNLTLAARCRLAEELEAALKPAAKENQQQSKGRGQKGSPLLAKVIDAREQAAKEANVSHGSMSAYKFLKAHAKPEVMARLESDPGSKLHQEANDLKRQMKRADHEKKVVAAQANPVPVSPGPFDLILADPPWRYDDATPNREVENQYPTSTVEEICKHGPNSKPNSVLFLWATAPKMIEAMTVMEKWGFLYRTHAIWDKQKIGMGHWFRGQHELLLVGVKGKFSPPDDSALVSSIFSEARTAHSKKPECVYEWIEHAFPGVSRQEMYARTVRKGWAAWGNEV